MERKNSKKVLAFRNSKSKKIRKFQEQICALDFETDGLGGNSVCNSFAILNYDGQLIESGIFKNKNHTKDLLDFIISKGPKKIWYSHNAQYDWRYLFDLILEREQELKPSFNMRTDTNVYQITLRPYADEKQTIILRDSMAIWSQSLEKLTQNFAPEHAKLCGVIDFKNETFDIHNEKHLEYALRDSEALALAMYNLNDTLVKLYGVSMGHTAAGTAMKAWKKTIDKTYYVHRASMDFCRKAYYGGLVFLTDTNKHKNCRSFDINSSYPSVMRKYGVPYGNPVRTYQFKGDLPAIYHCRITCPDYIKIPIIPYRDKHGATRWSTGRIETYCTSAEINFALKHGYHDLEIIRGEFWKEMIFPFNTFVDMAEKIRNQFRDTPAELLAKLIQNSLYGKFGTSQERRRVFFAETTEETIGAEPIDRNHILWAKKEKDEDVVTNPLWAAFITAHGRLELLKNVYDVLGVENVLYGDTDSITVKDGTDVSELSVGLEYGQFKEDKVWEEFRALAPKVYSGKYATGKKKGQWGGACKGIPFDSEDNYFEELFNKKIISREYLSLQSFWTGIKSGFVQAQMLERKSTDIANSGSWLLNEDGTVRPRPVALDDD